MREYPVLAWTLIAVLALSELALVFLTFRAFLRARARGEAGVQSAPLEFLWAIVPGLMLAATVVWSLSS